MKYEMDVDFIASASIEVEAGSWQEAVARVYDLFDAHEPASIINGTAEEQAEGIEVTLHDGVDPAGWCDVYQVNGVKGELYAAETLARKQRARTAYIKACDQQRAEVRLPPRLAQVED